MILLFLLLSQLTYAHFKQKVVGNNIEHMSILSLFLEQFSYLCPSKEKLEYLMYQDQS